MSGVSLSAIESTFAIVLVILFVLGRRTYAMIRGAVYSPGRLAGFGGFAILVYALFAASTLFDATSLWGAVALVLLVPYALVVAGAALFTAPHVRRTVHFERRDDGLTYYRIPWLVPVLYLALFAARFGLELFLIGNAGFFSPGPAAALPPLTVVTLFGFDLLYGVSLGLLLGRSIGVVRAHREFAAAQPSATGTDRGNASPDSRP